MNALPLIDTFGRVHNNLRVSVTDRCNLRCVYCMPEDVTFVDRAELLSFEEIERFVRAVAPLGVDKLRLTGGEPLMRRNLDRLVALLLPIPGIRDIGMTTNGLLLADQAEALHKAGLRRLNVSLDTLDPQRFRDLARRPGLEQTLDGLAEAKRLGFQVKLNAVAMRGVNDMDVAPLAAYARDNGFELRFIEYMPIGAEAWERDKVLYAHEILETLEAAFGPLGPSPDYDPRSPAMDFDYADGGGSVGMIASVSRPFCKSCNRIRLTAEGKFRNCLFALDETDMKPFLRGDYDPDRIRSLVRGSVHVKWEGHEIDSAKFVKPTRTMHAIGG